jgi:hypothetical protein
MAISTGKYVEEINLFLKQVVGTIKMRGEQLLFTLSVVLV